VTRAKHDDTGRLIDAADRLLDAVHREINTLREAAVEPEAVTVGAVINAIFVAWVDRLASQGLTSRRSVHLENVASGLAAIDAEALLRTDGRLGRIA
jgi:hypothetical protein